MTALLVEGVSRKFVGDSRTTDVLRSLSFRVKPHEVVALFGPNGCGKSTLFQILAGLDTGYEGSLAVGGKPASAAHIGYLFQNFSASLFPWLTLRENVAFPQTARAQTLSTRATASPEAILDHFGLREFMDHYPYQVSGGMQQRTCFGRTLATHQDLLLLDEPFSALDARGFVQMLQAFDALLKSVRPPTILICHDLDQSMIFADRVLVLSPRPAQVIEDVAVPFARPRDLKLLLDPHFQSVRSHILEVRLRAETAA